MLDRTKLTPTARSLTPIYGLNPNRMSHLCSLYQRRWHESSRIFVDIATVRCSETTDAGDQPSHVWVNPAGEWARNATGLEQTELFKLLCRYSA